MDTLKIRFCDLPIGQVFIRTLFGQKFVMGKVNLDYARYTNNELTWLRPSELVEVEV